MVWANVGIKSGSFWFIPGRFGSSLDRQDQFPSPHVRAHLSLKTVNSLDVRLERPRKATSG